MAVTSASAKLLIKMRGGQQNTFMIGRKRHRNVVIIGIKSEAKTNQVGMMSGILMGVEGFPQVF